VRRISAIHIGPLLASLAIVAAALLGLHYWKQDIESSAEIPRGAGISTPSSLAALLETPAQFLVGDVVFLNDVHLEEGPKPDIFLVSGAHGIRMLVVSDDEKSTRKPGIADIRGEIRRLPSAQILRKQWRLSRDEAEHFADQQIYIAAEYVKGQSEKPD
jgi:hypothetical protein